MNKFLSARRKSFSHATRGIKYIFLTQPNTLIHATISFVVVLLGIWLSLTVEQWALILLTIAIVWVAELFNTAVEVIVDLYSPEEHDLAKIIKDIAAGAVLVSAIAAIFVGLLVLAPPLYDKLFQ